MSNQSERAQQKLDLIRSYRAIFCNEKGDLLPDAEDVLRDLERECGWMPKALPTISTGAVDPIRIAADTEKRRVYAHIRAMLFGDVMHLRRATEED